ncbi:MAG: type IX secretion system membrane protein PorP/SprF [Bacteroidales bacterium]|nr:type IX secretion system membrane protein PorP/SprF [Bacteroidales bacterium]
MKLSRVLIGITLVFVFGNHLNAQNMPVHEQYMFDFMLVNPAFAGISEVTSVKMIHREQWVGIDDSPSTSFLMFKHRLKGRAGGIGGYIYSDNNGPNSYNGAQFSWSWQALLSAKRYNKMILSFGMSFRGLIHSLDESKFDRDLYDPIVDYSRKATFVPNANAGVVLSYKQHFLGASFENLIPFSDRMYNVSVEPIKYVIMNIHTGHILQLTPKVQFRPSALVKTNFHGLNQLDVNFKFHLMSGKEVRSVYIRYQNEIWLGLSYNQTLDWMHSAPLSLSPALGLNYHAFTFMYLYDLGLTSLQSCHFGSHQISIGIRFWHDKYYNWDKHLIPSFNDDF